MRCMAKDEEGAANGRRLMTGVCPKTEGVRSLFFYSLGAGYPWSRRMAWAHIRA